MSTCFARWREPMGFEDECFSESVDQMIDAALDSENPWLKGIDRERLERDGHVRLKFEHRTQIPVLSSQHFFPLPKVTFQRRAERLNSTTRHSRRRASIRLSSSFRPRESRHSTQAKEFPLELLARKADNFLNPLSLISVGAGDGRTGLLEMNAADAQARRSRMATSPRVQPARRHPVRARVDGAVQPGVVSAGLNWAKLTRGAGTLTSSPQKNLRTWATPPRFIPSWLKWSCQARLLRMDPAVLDGLHCSTV